MRIIIAISLVLSLFPLATAQQKQVAKGLVLDNTFVNQVGVGVRIFNFQSNYLIKAPNIELSTPYYNNFSLLMCDINGNTLKSSKFRNANSIKKISFDSKDLIIESNRILSTYALQKPTNDSLEFWLEIFDNNLVLIDTIDLKISNLTFGGFNILKNKDKYIVSYIKRGKNNTNNTYTYDPQIVVYDRDFKIQKTINVNFEIPSKYFRQQYNSIVNDDKGNIYFLHTFQMDSELYDKDRSFYFRYITLNNWDFITKLDDSYNILWTKQLPIPVNSNASQFFLSKDGSNIIVPRMRDTSYNLNGINTCCQYLTPTFNYYDTSGTFIKSVMPDRHIYLIDTAAFYKENYYQDHIKARYQYDNGDMLQAGFVEDDLLGKIDYYGASWISKYDSKGKEKWVRYINNPLLNNRTLVGNIVYGVTGGPNGSVVATGQLDDTFPNAKPFFNHPKILFLTLDSNGCWNGNCDTIMNLYEILSKSEDTHLNIGTKVYPNPSTGVFTLSIDSEAPLNDAQLLIYDIQGKMYIQRKIDITEHWQEQLSIDAPPGMYFVHMMHGGKHYVEKLMIVK
jgi:hypothetical protein